MNELIFTQSIPGRARVYVWQHDLGTSRFQVQKTFKDVRGRFRCTYKYFQRQAAAVRYAKRWLADQLGKEVSR